jgi:hypothetical protein
MRWLTAAGFLAGVVAVAGCSDVTPAAAPAAGAGAATAAVTGTATARVTPAAASGSGTAGGPAEHDGLRALAHIQELTKTPRVAGTLGEERAAEYIRDQFAADGYDVEIAEFEYDGDRFRAGSVTAGGQVSEVLTLAGSPGGKTSGPGVYVGLGDKPGIAGRDLRGKIAVADRGTLQFIEKYQNALDAGAVGLVVVNNQAGSFSGNLQTLTKIPVVGMSQEDGRAILAAAKQGLELTIDAPPTVGTSKAKNVIARAAKGARCRVVVGGHYDTVPSAQGANDNASGTANVLELARAFAADGLDKGLCFAAFSAEESGLYGSAAFVQQLEKEGPLPQAFINLDVTGIGNQAEVIGDDALVQEVLSVARDANVPAVRSSLPANSGSDHQSFQHAGVQSVWLFAGEYDTIHSPLDVTGDIQLDELDRLGDLAYAEITKLLARVARG